MAARRSTFHAKRGPVVWVSGLGPGGAGGDALRAALAPWATVRSVRILPAPKDNLPNTAVREVDVEVSAMREVQELLAHSQQVVLGGSSAGSQPLHLSLSPMDRTMRIELSRQLGQLDALTWDDGQRRLALGWTMPDTDDPDWAQSLVGAVVSLFTTSFAFRSAGEQPPVASLDALAAAVDITFDSLQDALVVYSNLKDIDTSLGIHLVWPKRNAFAPSALDGLDLPPQQAGEAHDVLPASSVPHELDLPLLQAGVDTAPPSSAHHPAQPAAANEGPDQVAASEDAASAPHGIPVPNHGWLRSALQSGDAFHALNVSGAAHLPGRPSRSMPVPLSSSAISHDLATRSASFHDGLAAEDEDDGWFVSAPSSDKPVIAPAPPVNDRRAVHLEFWQSRRSQPIGQDSFFGQVNPPNPEAAPMDRPGVAASGTPIVTPHMGPSSNGLLGLTFDAPLADERSLRTIWVGLHGAVPGYTLAELEAFFLPCGAMEEVYLPSPLRTRKMYAFITFLEYSSAVAALAYTGTIFRGTQIKVRPKTVWRAPAPAPAQDPSPAALLPPALQLDAAPASTSPQYPGAATVPPTPAKVGSPEETPRGTATRMRSDSDPGLRLGRAGTNVGNSSSVDVRSASAYAASAQGDGARAMQFPPYMSTPKDILGFHERSWKATADSALGHAKARSSGGDSWIMSPPPTAPSNLTHWPWSTSLAVDDGERSPPLTASYLPIPPATAPLPREEGQESSYLSPARSRESQHSASLSPPVLVHPDGTTVLASPGEDSAGAESAAAGSSGGWTLASGPSGPADGSMKRTASTDEGSQSILPPIPEGGVHPEPSNGPTAIPGRAPGRQPEGWVPSPAQDPAYYAGVPPMMPYPSATAAGVQPYPSVYPPPFVVSPAGPPQPGFHFGPYGMPPAPLGPPPHMMSAGWAPPPAPQAQMGASPIPPASLPAGLRFSPVPGNMPGPAYPHPLPPGAFPAFQQNHHPFGFSPPAPQAPHGRFPPSGPAASYGSAGRT